MEIPLVNKKTDENIRNMNCFPLSSYFILLKHEKKYENNSNSFCVLNNGSEELGIKLLRRCDVSPK